MTDADLDQIEQALGFPLPGHYRRFMLAYPRQLYAPAGAGGDPVAEWNLAARADRVIEFNRHVRAQPPGHFVDGRPWPDDHLVVGCDLAVDWYSVRRSDADPAVYCCTAVDRAFEPVAGSLAEYAASLVEWRAWADGDG
jgi:hypothetical protein